MVVSAGSLIVVIRPSRVSDSRLPSCLDGRLDIVPSPRQVGPPVPDGPGDTHGVGGGWGVVGGLRTPGLGNV